MTCDHYKKPCPFAGGAEDGARICFYCSKNTTGGQWPTREMFPMVKKTGLGDRVADMLKSVGIKPCEGCKKRQEALNAIGESIKEFLG